MLAIIFSLMVLISAPLYGMEKEVEKKGEEINGDTLSFVETMKSNVENCNTNNNDTKNNIVSEMIDKKSFDFTARCLRATNVLGHTAIKKDLVQKLVLLGEKLDKTTLCPGYLKACIINNSFSLDDTVYIRRCLMKSFLEKEGIRELNVEKFLKKYKNKSSLYCKCCSLIKNKHLCLKKKKITSLKGIESLANNSVSILDVSYNHIFGEFRDLDFPSKPFEKFSNLKALYIAANNMEVLNFGMLDGLKTINVLYMPGNKITKIIANKVSSSSLACLKHLNLSANRLKKIESNVLCNLVNLINLDISDNFIEDFSGALRGLSKLVTLDLSSNNIKTISGEEFSDLGNLEDLNLSGNKLRAISDTMFAHLCNARKINVSRNKLKKVDDRAFDNTIKLRELDLSDNKLETISVQTIEKLDSLEKVNLDDNDDMRKESVQKLSKLCYLTKLLITLPSQYAEKLSSKSSSSSSSESTSGSGSSSCSSSGL